MLWLPLQLHAARRGRYKVMWHSPIFDDEEGQHCKSTGSLCECNGNSVHTYDPPLVFDIAADPGESHPLSPTSSEHASATQFVQVRADEPLAPCLRCACARVLRDMTE